MSAVFLYYLNSIERNEETNGRAEKSRPLYCDNLEKWSPNYSPGTLKKHAFSAIHQKCEPEDFDLCQSTSQDSRSPVPVSVSDGGETSVFSHVAVCLSAQPVCFETHQTQVHPAWKPMLGTDILSKLWEHRAPS